MLLRCLACFVLLAAVSPLAVFAGAQKQCVSADEATRLINKDVCIAAHIYDVVELPNGTRYLDVCTPQTPDEQCRFTIVSLREDREEVGELSKYRDMDVRVRGIVQPMHGRSGMVLSQVRQFSGGPPKFRANSQLLRGFNAGQSKPPMSDPNLRSQGGGRSFMNTRDQETLPAK
jgi:hypothetical protein